MAQEEFLARSRVAFRMVDEDGNGTLSKKEMNIFFHDLLHLPEAHCAKRGWSGEYIKKKQFPKSVVQPSGSYSM